MSSARKLMLVWTAAMIGSFTMASSHAVEPSHSNRPIRLVSPSSAGGPVDIVARIVSQGWSEALGTTIVVDNRAGAAGLIGSELVAEAAPDGHTLLLGFSGPLCIVPNLVASTPYDTMKDFAPVSLVASAPYVLLVHPGVPAKTVAELVALAKARPGKLNFASGGFGVGLHMTGELFKLAAGINIVHVPYKGAGPAMSALLARQVDMMFNGVASALPMIRNGRLRALAVSGDKRSPALPGVPTLRQSGLNVSTAGWYGVLAPKGTPKPIIAELHRTLLATLKSTETHQRLTQMAMEVIASTPEEFSSVLKRDLATWGRVVKAAGLKAK